MAIKARLRSLDKHYWVASLIWENDLDLLAISRFGMQGDLQRLESISHNIANVITPGFKRQVSVASSFAIQVEQAVGQDPTVIALPNNAARFTNMIDPSSGAIRPTGHSQDVAIEGASFFEIQTPAGTAYTKAGSFRTDVQGRLVNAQNFPIMGLSGELSLTNNPFTVASNGNVLQEGRVVGRLKTVQFAHPEALQPAGNGTYRAGSTAVQEVATPAKLRVGFLEGSNVSSPQEMVRLTETVRHFEALQRVVQGYDETLEKTIRKLGDY